MNNTMEYRGYVGSVEFSEADQLLFGKVQGIRSLISYEGTTVSELIEDFHGAVDDYLTFVTLKGKLLKRLLKVVLTFVLKTLISTNGPQYTHIITT